MMFSPKLCVVTAISALATQAAQEQKAEELQPIPLDELEFMGNPFQKWLLPCKECNGERYVLTDDCHSNAWMCGPSPAQYRKLGKPIEYLCEESVYDLKNAKCETCNKTGSGSHLDLGLDSRLYYENPRSEWYPTNDVLAKNCVLATKTPVFNGKREIVAQCKVVDIKSAWERYYKNYYPFDQNHDRVFRIEAVHVPSSRKGNGYGTMLLQNVIEKIQAMVNSSESDIKVLVCSEICPFEDHEYAMKRIRWLTRLGFQVNQEQLAANYEHLRKQQIKKQNPAEDTADESVFVPLSIHPDTKEWCFQHSDIGYSSTLPSEILTKFKKEVEEVMNEVVPPRDLEALAAFETKSLSLARGCFLLPLELEITKCS